MALKPKVVVSLLTDQQDFQRMQADDARAAANRAGFDIELVFSENNAVLQIHQLFAYIHTPPENRPIAFVVESATAEGLERVARAGVQAGIGWVLVSARAPYLEILRKEFPGVLVSAATRDEEEIGKIQAQHFRTLLPNGGKIVCIEGPSPSAAAILRRQTMETAIRGSKITIEKTLTADWTEAGAERVLSSWLRLRAGIESRPDLLGFQNDAMAVGARRAIEAHRMEWKTIPMTGCDGLPEGGQALVKKGILAATIITPTTAGPGVDLVARALRREPLPPFLLLSSRSYPTLEELGRRRI